MNTEDGIRALKKLQRHLAFATTVIILSIGVNYWMDYHGRRELHRRIDGLNTKQNSDANADSIRAEVRKNRLETEREHSKFESLVTRKR